MFHVTSGVDHTRTNSLNGWDIHSVGEVVLQTWKKFNYLIFASIIFAVVGCVENNGLRVDLPNSGTSASNACRLESPSGDRQEIRVKSRQNSPLPNRYQLFLSKQLSTLEIKNVKGKCLASFKSPDGNPSLVLPKFSLFDDEKSPFYKLVNAHLEKVYTRCSDSNLGAVSGNNGAQIEPRSICGQYLDANTLELDLVYPKYALRVIGVEDKVYVWVK